MLHLTTMDYLMFGDRLPRRLDAAPPGPSPLPRLEGGAVRRLSLFSQGRLRRSHRPGDSQGPPRNPRPGLFLHEPAHRPGSRGRQGSRRSRRYPARPQQREGTHTELNFFMEQSLAPLVDAQHPIAHNKVMVIDSRTLITGSFNFTNEAENANGENLLILKGHPELIVAYRKNFADHKAHCRTPVLQAPAPATAPHPQHRAA